MSKLRLLLAACVLASAASAPSVARADGEAWFWVENRIPIVRTDKPEFPRLDWRVIGDFRFNQRSDGLHQAFARTGPAFYPTSWLFVALNGVVYADRLPDGKFEQEARVELEPNFFGRLGDFTFNDRNRVEYRYRDSGDRFRYRNQLRVNYAPKGERWIPYVWDEMLFDLSGLGFNQNRAEIGLARMLTETIRLDVGYMFRSREAANGDWTHDHILNLFFFFDVPPNKAREDVAPYPPVVPVVPVVPDAPVAPDAPAPISPPTTTPNAASPAAAPEPPQLKPETAPPDAAQPGTAQPDTAPPSAAPPTP